MNRFAGLALLGPYLRPHRGRVALALLSLLVAAGTVLAFGACLRALIDRGFAQGRPDVLNYALASLLVVAAGAGDRLGRALLPRVVARRAGGRRPARDLFAHVVRLGPAWFEIKRSGDVMSRISSDAQLIEQVIGSSASVALRNTLMCVGGIAMLVITNPKLALLGAGGGADRGGADRHLRPQGADSCRARPRRGSPTWCRRAARRSTPCAPCRPSPRKSARASASAQATERAFDAADRRASAGARIMTTLVIFIVFAAVGFLLWMGGQDVIAGEISAGDLSAFVFYAVLVATSGGAISETIGDLQRASGAAERLAELRAEQPVILEPAAAQGAAQAGAGRRRLRRRVLPLSHAARQRWRSTASTSRSRRARRWRSSARRARARPRSSTCCCASTIPEKGAIRLDGVDIRDLRLAELRAGAWRSCRRSRCCSPPASPRTSATAGPTRPTPR